MSEWLSICILDHMLPYTTGAVETTEWASSWANQKKTKGMPEAYIRGSISHLQAEKAWFLQNDQANLFNMWQKSLVEQNLEIQVISPKNWDSDLKDSPMARKCRVSSSLIFADMGLLNLGAQEIKQHLVHIWRHGWGDPVFLNITILETEKEPTFKITKITKKITFCCAWHFF